MPTQNLVYAKDRKEWRAWLRVHHKKETQIWLIHYKKHTGKPALTHRESMEEAICYGWIDTTIKKIDEERYVRGFARRNRNSRWSNATRGYAKELIRRKKMAKAGLHAYREGLKKPTIDVDLPKNPRMPADLKRALSQEALKNFDRFAPSYRRLYLRWILLAKRPETRAKRIQEVIRRSLDNRKPGL